MPTIKPYEGLSNDRLTDLINSENNTSLVEGVDFTYGPVTVSAGPQGRNTSIILTPPEESGFSETTIRYIRLPLTIMGLLPEGEVDYVDIENIPFTIHEILPKINASLGLSLTTSEVVNSTQTQAALQYPLTIVAGSFAWLPSTYNFKVRLPGTILEEDGDPLLTQHGLPFELESV